MKQEKNTMKKISTTKATKKECKHRRVLECTRDNVSKVQWRCIICGKTTIATKYKRDELEHDVVTCCETIKCEECPLRNTDGCERAFVFCRICGKILQTVAERKTDVLNKTHPYTGLVLKANQRHRTMDICDKDGCILGDVHLDTDEEIENSFFLGSLITAAPDMYNILHKQCMECKEWRRSKNWCKNCDVGEALKKARGI